MHRAARVSAQQHHGVGGLQLILHGQPQPGAEHGAAAKKKQREAEASPYFEHGSKGRTHHVIPPCFPPANTST